jgi:peptidoglycan/LPS O-acetylase OafA/YrhL
MSATTGTTASAEVKGSDDLKASAHLKANMDVTRRRSATIGDAWLGGQNNFNLIRLIAAWLVIYSHAWAITGTAGNDHFAQLTMSKSAGAFAVDVFFAVSGFLIAASFERHRWRDFLLARTLRIYPALIVCIALTVFVLGPVLTTDAHYWRDMTTWRYLWANATLWRAEFWLPGVFDGLPRTAVNGSLWTLPIEGRLYLALLFAGVVGMLRPWRYLTAWTLAIAGACAFALWRSPLPEHLAYLVWVTSFFITGSLIWVWRNNIPLRWYLFAALLIVAALTRGTLVFHAAYFALVAYGTFYLAFALRLPRIEKNDLSYGMYLYGWPMQQLALLAGASTIVMNIAAATVMAFACAALSWFAIERPVLRLKRRTSSAMSSSNAAVDAESITHDTSSKLNPGEQ